MPCCACLKDGAGDVEQVPVGVLDGEPGERDVPRMALVDVPAIRSTVATLFGAKTERGRHVLGAGLVVVHRPAVLSK